MPLVVGEEHLVFFVQNRNLNGSGTMSIPKVCNSFGFMNRFSILVSFICVISYLNAFTHFQHTTLYDTIFKKTIVIIMRDLKIIPLLMDKLYKDYVKHAYSVN